jgi:uncharacterized membrane protein YozB (DUF420 family)
MPAKNYLIPFALFLSLLFNGLVIGTMVGSLFVPEGSGLAGPAIALSYGAGGTLIALLIGVIFIKKLSRDWIKKVTLISSTLAVLLFGFLVVRYMQQQEKPDSNEAYGSLDNSLHIERGYIGKISNKLMSNENNLKNIG